jgi:hypothetical protein
MAGARNGGDEVMFGLHRDAPRLPGFRSWQVYLIIALLVAAATAGLLVTLTSHDGGKVAAGSPGGISVVGENDLVMHLKGAAGAELWVRYLSAGRGRGTIWLDLVATGLPLGYDYRATFGDCVKRHPRTLAIYSGLPDPGTGILVLALDNLPASAVATHAWIRVDSPLGGQLGGIQGSFDFMGNATSALGPHSPVC